MVEPNKRSRKGGIKPVNNKEKSLNNFESMRQSMKNLTQKFCVLKTIPKGAIKPKIYQTRNRIHVHFHSI